MQKGDRRVEVTPGIRFSVNNVTMACSLTALGAGISVLAPIGAVQQAKRAGILQRVLPDWAVGPFPVSAVTDTRLLPAKTRIFIEFLMERLSQNHRLGSLPFGFDAVTD